jgi:hypothetical protein
MHDRLTKGRPGWLSKIAGTPGEQQEHSRPLHHRTRAPVSSGFSRFEGSIDQGPTESRALTMSKRQDIVIREPIGEQEAEAGPSRLTVSLPRPSTTPGNTFVYTSEHPNLPHSMNGSLEGAPGSHRVPRSKAEDGSVVGKFRPRKKSTRAETSVVPEYYG